MLYRSGIYTIIRYKGEDLKADVRVFERDIVTEFQVHFRNGERKTLLYNHEVISDVSHWSEVGNESDESAIEIGKSLEDFIDYLNGKEIQVFEFNDWGGTLSKTIRPKEKVKQHIEQPSDLNF